MTIFALQTGIRVLPIIAGNASDQEIKTASSQSQTQSIVKSCISR